MYSSQTHADGPALPGGEAECGGHAKHAEFWAAPIDSEYEPMPQSVQTAEPVRVLYVPAAHGAHPPPSGPVEPALHVQ